MKDAPEIALCPLGCGRSFGSDLGARIHAGRHCPKREPKAPEANPKRGRGRPKGPCNKRELAQRRVAPIKDGQHATGVRRLAAPCKRDGCPLEFPCDAKRKADSGGGALETCPVRLTQDQTVVDRFREAIGGGDLSRVADLAAHGLASQHLLFMQEMDKLQREGMVIETVVGVSGETDDDEGESVTMTAGELRRFIANPRAAGVDRLAKNLGYTAKDQATTPHSRGETVRNYNEADHLKVMVDLKAKFGGVDE